MRVASFIILLLTINTLNNDVAGLYPNPSNLKKIGLATVENDEIRVIFTVYEYMASSIRFNLTIINLKDEFILRDHVWGYFNAEIYSMDDVYIGKVREEDDEHMLFFLAKNGIHVRHWSWDYTILGEGGSTRLGKGSYKMRGVFIGPDYTLKTDVFEVYLVYRPPPVQRKGNPYGSALMSASFGVLASGLVQQIYISLFYPEPVNWPSKKRMITVLWMFAVIFSTILLALSSEYGYEVIRIIVGTG